MRYCKRLTSFVLVLVMAFSMIACTSEQPEKPESTGCVTTVVPETTNTPETTTIKQSNNNILQYGSAILEKQHLAMFSIIPVQLIFQFLIYNIFTDVTQQRI